MFEKVSRSLKYDSNIFFVHKHINIYMDTSPDHFTPLALCVWGKYVPLVKQNVMKLEVFISCGQRIDQKRKKGWWRGRRERIEKESREKIEIERKETKGN